MRQVLCDSCHTNFKIKKIKKRFLNDAVEGRITISFFTCPKCKKEYKTFVENEKLSKLVKEKNKVYAGIRNLKDPVEIESAFAEHKKIEQKVERLHNHLKFVFKER